MADQENTYVTHYLPAEADALKWGLHVLHCGMIGNPPDTPYIQGEEEHSLWWEMGRKLDKFIVGYLVKGRGVFESEATGLTRLRAGDALVLFPDAWHRYRPLRSTDWHELWVGFDGDYARQVMPEFFSPDTPVLRIGHSEELLGLMRSLLDLAQVAPAGYQQIMAGRTVEILAQVRSLAMNYHAADRDLAGKIQQARCALIEQAESNIDLQTLAHDVGMSYSHFRAVFKSETGTSPHQYQLEVRMNTARSLLANSQASVSDIADRLGFSSVYYFSRLFKKRTGLSPTDYRRR